MLTVDKVGFVLFGAIELASISYGIGATEIEPGFDLVKAAMVSEFLETNKIGRAHV